MASQRKTGLILVVVGAALLVYGLWALTSDEVLSTWLRVEKPTGIPYWITVFTLISLGAINVVIGIRFLLRSS